MLSGPRPPVNRTAVPTSLFEHRRVYHHIDRIDRVDRDLTEFSVLPEQIGVGRLVLAVELAVLGRIVTFHPGDPELAADVERSSSNDSQLIFAYRGHRPFN